MFALLRGLKAVDGVEVREEVHRKTPRWLKLNSPGGKSCKSMATFYDVPITEQMLSITRSPNGFQSYLRFGSVQLGWVFEGPDTAPFQCSTRVRPSERFGFRRSRCCSRSRASCRKKRARPPRPERRASAAHAAVDGGSVDGRGAWLGAKGAPGRSGTSRFGPSNLDPLTDQKH